MNVVFPTPVGVFLLQSVRRAESCRLPHARGGVSFHDFLLILCPASSPRPWGCFLIPDKKFFRREVFPTPVGVFPHGKQSQFRRGSLPHARGGVSPGDSTDYIVPQSSPRPWGCFHSAGQNLQQQHVFPTPVGVFPLLSEVMSNYKGLPHARGGVSSWGLRAASQVVSSPRPWGCFLFYAQKNRKSRVFPTPVGVFLIIFHSPHKVPRLPHARGGVSW